MADRKAITSLGSLVTPAAGDELIITDVSDTTDGANGTTKKITRDNLIGTVLVGLEGVTASAAELNILEGATLDVDELNTLEGITASTAELNIMDGVTATAAELNITDGGDTTGKVLATPTKARVYLSTNQLNIANSSFVKVLFDTVSYDVGSDFNTGTNRFVAPVAGFYLIVLNVVVTSGEADKMNYALVYKNGSSIQQGVSANGAGTTIGIPCIGVHQLAANDYIEGYVYLTTAGGGADLASGVLNCSMAIHLLSV